MDPERDEGSDAPPATPPMRAGAIGVPARPSSWATIIGTIAIVFGGGGLLAGVWGALGPYFTNLFSPWMLEGQAAAIQRWMSWTVIHALLSGVLAALLLVGGIRLLRKRCAARRMLRAWAVAKMLVVAFGLIIGWFSAQAQLAVLQGQPSIGPLGSGFQEAVALEVYGVVGVGTMACGLLWGWAPPVFVLVWFSRRRIISEMAGWS